MVTLDDLKEAITREIRAIPQNLLEKAVKNFEKRIEICIRKKGGHFEALL